MKALKKSICLFLCLGMLSLCTACSGEEKTISEKELMQQGMELVEQMDTLAESGVYTQSMTNNEEVSSLIEKFGEGEYAEPEKSAGCCCRLMPLTPGFPKCPAKPCPTRCGKSWRIN